MPCFNHCSSGCGRTSCGASLSTCNPCNTLRAAGCGCNRSTCCGCGVLRSTGCGCTRAANCGCGTPRATGCGCGVLRSTGCGCNPCSAGFGTLRTVSGPYLRSGGDNWNFPFYTGPCGPCNDRSGCGRSKCIKGTSCEELGTCGCNTCGCNTCGCGSTAYVNRSCDTCGCNDCGSTAYANRSCNTCGCNDCGCGGTVYANRSCNTCGCGGTVYANRGSDTCGCGSTAYVNRSCDTCGCNDCCGGGTVYVNRNCDTCGCDTCGVSRSDGCDCAQRDRDCGCCGEPVLLTGDCCTCAASASFAADTPVALAAGDAVEFSLTSADTGDFTANQEGVRIRRPGDYLAIYTVHVPSNQAVSSRFLLTLDGARIESSAQDVSTASDCSTNGYTMHAMFHAEPDSLLKLVSMNPVSICGSSASNVFTLSLIRMS